ncbi:hypothetical protein LTR56_015075 [Elasticomyces elasticus]|nr:hypothetical protein LTR56_015075 [Elasticomyces elasticus]KAK3639297.1 hypothetical protein LTR22_017498 [Elasticomyces elasticus]KAK4915710.1 hypothetical protein LTR49_016194 [Elasticomyces elasticus]KAK5746061.1 hypothetical protein LTS12_022875 [Elasticomyces elasticus]
MVVDPLSAVGAAAACLELARSAKDLAITLYRLYEDTKKVNETVRTLAEQVESLRSACELVHEELVPIVHSSTRHPQQHYDVNGRLWRSIGTELDKCHRSIAALGHTVSKVGREYTNFARQLGRQIQLNWSKEQMVEAQRRIENHSQSLQLILLVVNIKVTHIAPGLANKALIDKLDNLHTALTKQQQQRPLEPPRDSGVAGVSPLINCAALILSSGTTLYEVSVASGSVQGGTPAAGCNLRVAEWTETLAALQLGAERSMLSGDTSRASTVSSETEESKSQTDVTSPEANPFFHRRSHDNEPEDCESEDDFATDLAEAALREGSQAFDLQHWVDAESLLKGSLADLQRLPTNNRPATISLSFASSFLYVPTTTTTQR